MLDLKEVYQAATRESAEVQLRQLADKWQDKYAVAIRSWQNNWDDCPPSSPIPPRSDA